MLASRLEKVRRRIRPLFSRPLRTTMRQIAVQPPKSLISAPPSKDAESSSVVHLAENLGPPGTGSHRAVHSGAGSLRRGGFECPKVNCSDLDALH